LDIPGISADPVDLWHAHALYWLLRKVVIALRKLALLTDPSRFPHIPNVITRPSPRLAPLR